MLQVQCTLYNDTFFSMIGSYCLPAGYDQLSPPIRKDKPLEVTN